jgi:hypothetical protein
VTGAMPVASTFIVNTSGAPSVPLMPNVIAVPSCENDAEYNFVPRRAR